jgi:hypothetical protein
MDTPNEWTGSGRPRDPQRRRAADAAVAEWQARGMVTEVGRPSHRLSHTVSPERAGGGNRTRIISLEGWSSTIELRPLATWNPSNHADSRTAASCDGSHLTASAPRERVALVEARDSSSSEQELRASAFPGPGGSASTCRVRPARAASRTRGRADRRRGRPTRSPTAAPALRPRRSRRRSRCSERVPARRQVPSARCSGPCGRHARPDNGAGRENEPAQKVNERCHRSHCPDGTQACLSPECASPATPERSRRQKSLDRGASARRGPHLPGHTTDLRPGPAHAAAATRAQAGGKVLGPPPV